MVQLTREALPPALEWGEVLVGMRAAPVNPADQHVARTGGVYGRAQIAPPFFAGQDGVGVVAKVCWLRWSEQLWHRPLLQQWRWEVAPSVGCCLGDGVQEAARCPEHAAAWWLGVGAAAHSPACFWLAPADCPC